MPESHERPPRRRRMLFALVAVAVVLAVLAWLTCRGERDAPESARDAAPVAGTTTTDASPSRGRARARAVVEPEAALPVASVPDPTAGGAADADGWPAADIVVRHPDGRPAAGAVVYVHLAGERCDNLETVARRSADMDGRVRFPAPHAGRYDVGAFLGQGFSTLVRDVDFPATRPVVIDLPALARLDVRVEGALPADARASIGTADAERFRAFPGRGEGKYGDVPTRPPGFPIEVPRGVPLRVHTSGGIVADPPVLTAPGTVTLRPDGRIAVPVDLVFVGPEPPDHIYAVQLTVEAPTAEEPGPHVLDYGTMPRQLPRARRFVLRAPPGPVELRLSMRGQGPVITSVFAAPLPEGQAHRVEVPVVSWPASECFRLRVTVAGTPKLSGVRAVIGLQQVPLDVGETRPFTPQEPVGATAQEFRDVNIPFVAAPQMPAFGGTLELVLVPGADVVMKGARPPGLDKEWPLTVELADGRPFVGGFLRVVSRMRLETGGAIGRFPPGDVELVFRLAGREIGHRTVHVVAGPPIEVDVPELAPPKR